MKGGNVMISQDLNRHTNKNGHSKYASTKDQYLIVGKESRTSRGKS